MDAVRARRKRDVDAVVDDDPHTMLAGKRDRLDRGIVELTGCRILLAKLDQRRTAVDQTTYLLEM